MDVDIQLMAHVDIGCRVKTARNHDVAVGMNFGSPNFAQTEGYLGQRQQGSPLKLLEKAQRCRMGCAMLASKLL